MVIKWWLICVSFLTLEMEGQVEDIALWDTVFCSVCSGCALHILANVEGYVAFPCIHNIFIQHSTYILYTAESKYTLLNKANIKVTFAKHFTSVRWHFWALQHIEQKIIIMLSWTHMAADTSSKKKSCFRRGGICNDLIWKQSLHFFNTTFIITVHFDLMHKISQNSCCLLVKLRD